MGDTNKYLVLCHGAALLGFFLPGVGFILGPLIIWIWKKDSIENVDEHGKAALNFQISCVVYWLVGWALTSVGIGFFILTSLGFVWFICVIFAALRAVDGRLFQYPLLINFIK